MQKKWGKTLNLAAAMDEATKRSIHPTPIKRVATVHILYLNIQRQEIYSIAMFYAQCDIFVVVYFGFTSSLHYGNLKKLQIELIFVHRGVKDLLTSVYHVTKFVPQLTPDLVYRCTFSIDCLQNG